jgi:acetylornithine deacetylase
MALDPVALTRRLVDIPSVSGDERECGEFLDGFLGGLAHTYGGNVQRMPVEGDRFNVLATFGDPVITYSTHFDTVPPFFASSEDEEWVYGRGSCDAKGILATMICAVERLLSEDRRGLALLFVVGEEQGSAGAKVASQHGIGSRYLINGEPTENQLAVGTKGALRLELHARGRMAHSAYPELGDSAIDKLVAVLGDLAEVAWPVDDLLGPTTVNVGTLRGGRAPNVIADEAVAELLIRLVGDPDVVRSQVESVVGGRLDVREVLCIPAVHLGTVPGIETCAVKYTTDIPLFGPSWGEPFLLGPGTIHVAHTEHERISKRDLSDAVDLYARLGRELLSRG